MAPLRLADHDTKSGFENFLSIISSKSKFKPFRRQILSTHKIVLTEEPTGFEFKPPRPEKDPWLGIADLQNTDGPNWWNHNSKRSGRKYPPVPSPITRIPALLTFILVQDQEGLVRAQHAGGEYQLSYAQGLSLAIFIFLVMALLSIATMRAMPNTKKGLRRGADRRRDNLERINACMRLSTLS